jgi:hypothetical protein
MTRQAGTRDPACGVPRFDAPASLIALKYRCAKAWRALSKNIFAAKVERWTARPSVKK